MTETVLKTHHNRSRNNFFRGPWPCTPLEYFLTLSFISLDSYAIVYGMCNHFLFWFNCIWCIYVCFTSRSKKTQTVCRKVDDSLFRVGSVNKVSENLYISKIFTIYRKKNKKICSSNIVSYLSCIVILLISILIRLVYAVRVHFVIWPSANSG